ncbi:protein BREAST CANCER SUSCEPTIBILITY 2 homolog B-like isoform X7 [Triticum dicoccoides]|uniref:protein BREAST CANCER SUSCEPTIBILITY 2 homolog B-like isoform X7 n=1 Tax=Triticum dicoccoides TaxID=85692 RepID=UPI00188F0B1F|nr:protein BREAST CANCER SUSCEPTIBILITY 2 homolog B-like isoform X7 [Triticum dicoccoides]
MPGRWRVWGQPDGRLVWIPAPEPDAPPPPAAAPPLPPPLPLGRGAGIAADPSEDALAKGRGAADGCRVESMADLLVQARNTLLEGDGMSGATVDAGEGQLFCTGSGRSVSVSERAIRRARALVGEEVEKAGNKRKQPFDDVPGAEGESREMDAPFRGGVHNTTVPPVFQTGSGKAVLLGKDSIQKARAILGEQPFDHVPDAEGELSEMDAPFRGGVYNTTMPPVFQTGSGKAVLLGKDSIQKARVLLEDVDSAAGAVQPMFCTGMGRPVPMSRTSIDKARAVLEGQIVAEKGVDGMEQFPLFQTGSGRVVSVTAASVQKAKSVLKDNNTREENTESFGRPNQPMMFQTGSGRPAMISERSIERSRAVANEGDAEKSGHWDTDCQFPVFQTGLGKPVAVSWSSVQKAKAVLEEEKIKTTGRGESSDCATTLQTETPTSVLMSSSLIMNSRSVTPKEDSAMQVTRTEKNHKDDDHVPLFQTGLGRSIAISKSSLKRASAVLEPRNIAKELEDEAHLDGAHDTPAFRTGLGRSILASENSRKELPILEAEEAVKSVNNYNRETFVEEATFQAGIQKFVPQNRISSHKASMLLEQRNFMEKGYKDSGSQLPLFRTGSGKSVLISESSVQKARAVLEEQGINKDNHKLLNMDKKIPVFASPLKTSCARTVNISSVGVSRAATLLGLEENTLSTQFFGHVGDKLGTKINFEQENAEQRLGLASYPTENQVHKEPHRPFELSNNTISDSGEHSIRFSTAGGRSMAISSDALERAKSLLGESDLVVSTNNLVSYPLGSACNDKMQNSTVVPKEGGSDLSKRRRVSGRTELATFSHQAMSDRKDTGSFGNAVSDIHPTSENTNRFHVGSRSTSEIPKIVKSSSRCLSETDNTNDTKDKTQQLHMPAGALFDISNFMGSYSGNIDHVVNEKRRILGRNSASSFKRPRSSRFITPISTNRQSSAGVPKPPPTQITSCRTKLSAYYPFQHKRKTWKEYFGGPPCFNCLAEHIIDEVKLMDAKGAEKYKFHNMNTGAEEFQKLLIACGASLTYATKEWVNNHYKWIVWKLGSLERCYPTKAAGKFLTVANVLDELKYRYALEASLDVALSEQLQKRKLFIGQKLRIWGASLCGWTGPVSFHEASGTVKLMVHVNGSYRARWDDPLGFCKHVGPPLAFKCIKASGGRVPRTLVGVARIYPVLYKERLPDGSSIVRSERMERKALQLYHQRVSKIAEDIMSEQDENCASTDDSEEGAKICKMLEQAAEPEVMMAGLTSEQMISFSSYQAKQKEARQNEVAKKVENALEVAGLSSRDVTPFLKVRVTSLAHKISATKTINKEGLITIWNPTEKQKADLVEGQVYIATGLLPSAHCTNILYLHARGSSTMWKPLASAQAADFQPFFTPRKAVELSLIGEVPLASLSCSEFDIAGVVLHVGEVYLCSNQKRQWLFLTDGSKFISASQSTEQDDCLLAVSFSCSSASDDGAFFSYALSGNTVGFSNLVKRQKDQTRHIWVAEATQNSTFTLSHEISKKSHLKEAATCAEKWASSSFDKIQQLKEKVLCIIGDSGG